MFLPMMSLVDIEQIKGLIKTNTLGFVMKDWVTMQDLHYPTPDFAGKNQLIFTQDLLAVI